MSVLDANLNSGLIAVVGAVLVVLWVGWVSGTHVLRLTANEKWYSLAAVTENLCRCA
jgi:hypothetical protein